MLGSFKSQIEFFLNNKNTLNKHESEDTDFNSLALDIPKGSNAQNGAFNIDIC